ncbi:MAG: GNAT family N-acetyltransferase [Leptospiraceae bacterium]|nr:GNAT family N-acetyltransferase [Leptospiraceae bacterium]
MNMSPETIALDSDHIKEILDLEKLSFGEYHWNESQLTGHLNHHFGLGIKYENKPIGYLLYSENEWEIEVFRIGITNDLRRSGLGSILIDILKQKQKKIYLEVNEENLPARNFYTKHNFREIGKRKGYYSESGNSILLLYIPETA